MYFSWFFINMKNEYIEISIVYLSGGFTLTILKEMNKHYNEHDELRNLAGMEYDL